MKLNLQSQLRRFSRCCARLRATLNRLPGIFGIWGGNLFVSRRSERAAFPFFLLFHSASLFLFFYLFLFLFCFSVSLFSVCLLDAFHFGHFPLAALVVLCFATICSLLFYLAILKIYNKGEHLKMNYLVVFFSASASASASSPAAAAAACVFRRLLFFFGCNSARGKHYNNEANSDSPHGRPHKYI